MCDASPITEDEARELVDAIFEASGVLPLSVWTKRRQQSAIDAVRRWVTARERKEKQL